MTVMNILNPVIYIRLLRNRIIVFFIIFPIWFSDAQNYFCVEYIGMDHPYENVCDYKDFENILSKETCDYVSFSVNDTTCVNRITYLLRPCENYPCQTCVYPSAVCYWYDGDSLVNMYELGIEFFRNIKANEVYRIPWEIWLILKENISNVYEEKVFKRIDGYVKHEQIRNECDEFVFKRKRHPSSMSNGIAP